MVKQADRYSVIRVHGTDLLQRLTDAQNLGLKFFVQSDLKASFFVVHLFFDNSGMHNYLSGIWGNVGDSVRLILEDRASDRGAIEEIKGVIGGFSETAVDGLTRELVSRWLADDGDPCVIDHNGLCQAHLEMVEVEGKSICITKIAARLLGEV